MIQTALATALLWRKNLGLFARSPASATETLRIFYGPGESEHPELKKIALDLFGNHVWMTAWEKLSTSALAEVTTFLKTTSPSENEILSVVLMDRSQKPTQSQDEPNVVTVWGSPPQNAFATREFGVPYLIRFTETKHPGLFLDHAPLRQWLLQTQSEKTVLNLFSYTGSLSVAAAKGYAQHVTTIDLSKSTIEWAQANWANAGLSEEKGRFIYGDVLEWLPRLAKKQESFDTILCDPPSFSRSKNGSFSTQKDSQKLHELIFPLLKKGGVLVTSINSENYPETSFLKNIHDAASATQSSIQILKRIDLPETFPTHSTDLTERYLKGFYVLKN